MQYYVSNANDDTKESIRIKILKNTQSVKEKIRNQEALHEFFREKVVYATRKESEGADFKYFTTTKLTLKEYNLSFPSSRPCMGIVTSMYMQVA